MPPTSRPLMDAHRAGFTAGMIHGEIKAREHYIGLESQLTDAQQALEHEREQVERLTEALTLMAREDDIRARMKILSRVVWTPSQSKSPNEPF